MEKQETKTEETPVGDKQPESTETPQITPREEELTKELEKARSQADTFKGLLKQEQQKSITRDDLQPIYDRIDGQQRFIATALQDFRGTEGEYGEKARKNYVEDAETDINKSKESRKPVEDPEAKRFFEYLGDEGLVWEDDFVQEALKGVDLSSVKEVSKTVKAAVKQRNETKTRDDFKKEIDEGKRQFKEEILKEYGLTDLGPGGPSAPSRDLKSMTPDEKLQEGFKQYKKK